jgi:hypothetical protein
MTLPFSLLPNAGRPDFLLAFSTTNERKTDEPG